MDGDSSDGWRRQQWAGAVVLEQRARVSGTIVGVLLPTLGNAE